MDIFTLTGKILIDNAAANQSLSSTGKEADTAGNKMAGMGSKMQEWGGKVKKLIAGLAIGAAIKKGFDVAKQAVTEFTDRGDDIDKMSQKFSMSAEGFQQWESIAGHNGTSIEIIGKSIKTVTTSLEKNKDAYEALGVATTNADGSLRDSQSVFQDTILALSDMEAGTERDAKAKELLGGKYQELLPLINGGSESIREQIEASKSAVTMTDEQVKKAAAFKDAQQAMQEQIDKVKMSLVTNLVPALTKVMDWVTTNLPKMIEFIKPVFDVVKVVIDGVISGISSFIDSLMGLMQSNTETGQELQGVWNTIKEMFGETFKNIQDLIQAFVEVAKMLWEEWGDTISIYIDGIWKAIQIIFDTAFKVINDLLKIFTALFKGDWEGLWEGIKQLVIDIWEGIKALIENQFNTIKELISSIGEKISKYWEDLWGKVSKFCSNTWENIKSGIQNGVQNVWKSTKDMATKVVEALKDLPKEGLNIAKNFVQGFIEGIKSMVSNAVGTVKDFSKSCVNAAKDFLGIHSPSRVMMEVGAYTAEGMALGIENNTDKVTKAVKEMTSFKDEDYSIGAIGNAYPSKNITPEEEKESVQDKEDRQIVINMYYPQVKDKTSIKETSRQLREEIFKGDRAVGLT